MTAPADIHRLGWELTMAMFDGDVPQAHRELASRLLSRSGYDTGVHAWLMALIRLPYADSEIRLRLLDFVRTKITPNQLFNQGWIDRVMLMTCADTEMVTRMYETITAHERRQDAFVIREVYAMLTIPEISREVREFLFDTIKRGRRYPPSTDWSMLEELYHTFEGAYALLEDLFAAEIIA